MVKVSLPGELGEVVPQFNAEVYKAPKSMSYAEYFRKANTPNEDKQYPFIDNLSPPPQGLLADLVEPSVTA